jgi:hypothetical protein
LIKLTDDEKAFFEDDEENLKEEIAESGSSN